jgi:hypothetical protein
VRARKLVPALFLLTFVMGMRPLERTEFTKRRIASMQPALRLLDASLSGDGAHVGYAATDGKREYPVLDERVSAAADVVVTPAIGNGATPLRSSHSLAPRSRRAADFGEASRGCSSTGRRRGSPRKAAPLSAISSC